MSDYSDEDIADLEDEASLVDTSTIIIADKEVTPDTPVYRLRLFYSYETFLAAFNGEKLENGRTVLVPTRYGKDLAQVIGPVSRNPFYSEVVLIERTASDDDLEKAALNREQEREAFDITKQKIAVHRLEMKLVSVHYLLEDPKILFFFTAETRVDFRELVKDLVNIFHARIELRQIGIRDESRVLGGLGICGRGYCCHAVSDKLKPVSIKMAKDQNLSLNSMKISGPCGRLLCCLSYEHCFYCEQRRISPQEGSRVIYNGNTWRVLEVNVVLGLLKIVADDSRQLDVPISSFEKSDGHWRSKPEAQT
jgi:cell fate regulator YaaT (PSP1 superfamily)